MPCSVLFAAHVLQQATTAEPVARFGSTTPALSTAAAAYAVRTQAPPTSLIFFSASLLKNLAFTTTGCSGSWPLPSTFDRPYLVTSMTGALALSLAAATRA